MKPIAKIAEIGRFECGNVPENKKSANFGDLDYASTDPAEIELTLKYDYAILQF